MMFLTAPGVFSLRSYLSTFSNQLQSQAVVEYFVHGRTGTRPNELDHAALHQRLD